MIPLTATLCQDTAPKSVPDSPWQRALAQAVRHPVELLAALGLQHHPLADELADGDFPLRVPRGYIARMRHGDPHDPLLLQVLPRGAEAHAVAGFGADPVGDHAATASPGLLHKYAGRVLLVTTGACPVHCRYCFRRHYPYADNHLDEAAWQAALDYIAADASIHEVILSGGDPLSLSNERLADIGRRLADIPHLRRLRIHSRMPIVLPERIDRGLLDWLAALPWQTVLVTHCNHAQEIDAEVRHALRALRAHGVTLLNQAVLLRDINDTAQSLCALSESLFEAGVLPYYLHQLDRVQGAAHFEVTETRARQLMGEMQRRLPGFLVPRLVREVPGEKHKMPL